MIRHALVFEHFEKRISGGNADATNIEGGGARMHAGRAINGLRKCAGWFDASNAGRSGNTDSLGILFIYFDRFLSKFRQHIWIANDRRIPLSSQRHAK